MKKLTVSVCLDDKLGMMLFGKRQSRDRVLVADFVDSAAGKNIFINPFSKILFENYPDVRIVDDLIKEADEGSFCFIENLDPGKYLSDIETFIVYRWNRLYTSDVKFKIDLAKEGYKLISLSEFEGRSHDKITKEIYTK